MNRTHCVFLKLAVSLFALSALLNLFLVFQWTLLEQEMEKQNNQLRESSLFQVETIIRNLVSDLIVYGQKQPAIYDFVLKKYGVNPPAPFPTPPLPSKSPSK